MTGSANLAAVLETRTEQRGWAERPALAVGERTFTHAEVHDHAARTAALLVTLGLSAGDRLLLAVADTAEFAWVFLGAVRLGALVIPVNPRLPAGDHQYMVQDSLARAVVCDAELAERFARGSALVLTADELADGLQRHSPLPPAEVRPDAPAYAQYTSGTTGAPKAAVHRHGDPLVYFHAFAASALHLGSADVVMSVSKMYFAYGLGNSLFFPLLSGCQAVLHPGRPTPEVICHLAERHSPTVLFAVPTFYAHLLRMGNSQPFASLRAAVSAGEALVTTLAERARRFLGCPILDGLGSTEVGQTFVSNTMDDWRDGTVGRTLPPYEVVVRDAQGRDLGPGRIGTLWVRGPTVMLEYLHKPEATAAVKVGEWLCSGDLALLDANGYLHHRGRVDDLEMVGGISVAPREIEEVLCRHPAVSEVAVAAVRAPDGASSLKAFVVLAPAVTPDAAVGPEAVAAELIASVRDRLAPYKVPRSVVFVDALPRTATGKLRRFVLRNHGATAQENRPR